MNIFENLETGVQIIDETYRYRYLNKSLLNELNRPADDYLGKTMSEVYPGIEETQLFQKITECLQNSTFQKMKNEFIFEDNQITYWDITIEKIPEGVIIFSKNITNTDEGISLLLESNKRLQNKIKESSKLLAIANKKIGEENIKFTKIFNYLPDPCFIVDIETLLIIECNPAMEKILDASRKDIIGFSHIDLSPEYQKHLNKSSLEANQEVQEMLQNEYFLRFEWDHRTLSGRPIFVDVSVSHLLINGKKLFLCVWKDNTLIKKQQAEIEAQTKRAQHNAKLASVGLLAAGVGHEINNPLTIINGYLFNLKNKLLNNKISSIEDLSRIFHNIERASERIAKIVTGLNNFSRNDNSVYTKFSPLEVINESFNLVEAIYKKDHVDLKLVLLNDCIDEVIFGSRGKFEQIIMNLLSNAKDAVRLNSTKKIDFECFNDRYYFYMKVTDNGPGIPDEIQDKIFDPFFTTKEINRGTGLGLSLAHEFVQELNGNISFNSVAGVGTSFFISIPIALENQLLEEFSVG